MRFFSKKEKINFRTFTLTQAIRLKTQERDFSYRTEHKILAIIYEHLKYNDSAQSYLQDGRSMTVARWMYNHYVTNADIIVRDNNLQLEIREAFTSIISRTYFWLEVTKSIEMLTNPAHITNGHRRGLILDLLQDLSNSLLTRIRCEIAVLSLRVFPVTQVPFSRLPINQREDFISNMFDTVKGAIEHRGVTRNPRMTTYYMTIADPGRPHEQIPVSNDRYRSFIGNYQRQLTGQISRLPINPANWPNRANAQAGAGVSAGNARLLQAVNTNALSSKKEKRRLQMHKDMGLLFEHMEKVRDLSPGQSVTVYEYENSYYTEEECKEENIPMNGKPIVLKHMNEEVFRKKCDALRAKFRASFPDA